MTEDEVRRITKFLADNKDLFAWTAKDMSGIDPRVMCHRQAVRM